MSSERYPNASRTRRKGPGILSGVFIPKIGPEETQKREEETVISSPEKTQDLSLGELNPLIHFIDFANRPAINSLKKVTSEIIESHEGIQPVFMGTEIVTGNDPKEIKLRFIARFETETLNESQMKQLESLAEETYSYSAVRTRKTVDKKKDLVAESYPSTDKLQFQDRNIKGWYLGPGGIPTDPLHQGLYVFKDFGELTSENLLTKDATPNEEPEPEKFLIEVREGGMYQTDIVTLISQVSSIISGQGKMDYGDTVYDAYYKLMRLGLKDFNPNSIYGLQEEVNEIKRRLIYPLTSPKLSKGILQEPSSALLIGVPGTGKTLIAEQLLSEDTGVLIVPITPIDLFKELTTEPSKQFMFKRISSVAKSTGKRVILHIDDVENITEEKEKTQSSLLNLMAGVTDSGFHMIASTNEPERIGNALLQPQRFGVLIYCGLQNDEARKEIIDIHATKETVKEGKSLFESEEVRDLILDEVVKRTEGFTPRFLSEIATVAKSYLLERVARQKGTHINLTEKDLDENHFVLEDWARAVSTVSKKYDREGTKKRDKEIREFTLRTKTALGFRQEDVYDASWQNLDERIAAIRARNKNSQE